MPVWGNIYAPAAIKAAKKREKKRLIKAAARDAIRSPEIQEQIAKMTKAIAYKRALSGESKPKQAFQPPPEYRHGMGALFYKTREWRRLRYKALTLHGAKCQCCGAVPEQGEFMHVDHIKPRSKHPELELVLNNLQVLCEACNVGKSNIDETDWRKVPGVAVAPLKA